MRSSEKLKLNQFSKNELEQRKMNALKGGCLCVDYCMTQCNYEGPGRALNQVDSVLGTGMTYEY